MDNKLQDLLNRDDCFLIHYASNGFYNGSSPAPKISCIVIFNKKNNQCFRFTLKDHLQGHSKEEAERLLLENFKLLFDKYPNVSFIHWNMTANGFGFKAIQARAQEFGIEIPVPDKENLFDLASYIEYLAGKKLSIKQILWFNSLLDNEYLDGKTEAEYFKKWKFEEIRKSVHSKVMALSFLVDEIKDETLRTEAPHRNDDGLTKEERREQALKLAEVREKMINDIYEHNRKIQAQNERILEKFENIEPEYIEEEEFFFFDFAHPFASLFANWFANR